MNFLQRLFPPKRPENLIELGRNEQCWCGSGKKYKRCHLSSDGEYRTSQRAASRKTNGSPM